jgi:two-component system CheB/CheR fusion protein
MSGDSVPIVGIGASAGGTGGAGAVSRTVPEADSGMAFVIVQHLDPTHKGMLPELLQRATGNAGDYRSKPHQGAAGLRLCDPAEQDMSILHGVLHLLEPVAPRGLRLPIDFFFRSLAEDQREHSGRRHPLRHGLGRHAGPARHQGEGGLVLAQEPATAKFDSMPRSAIDAGLADIVAPVERCCRQASATTCAHAPACAKTAGRSGRA